MANLKKVIFMKFKINKELDAIDRFFLSEDRNTVDNWRYNSEEKEESAPASEEKREDSFRNVFTEFERTMESFQNSARFIMSVAPIMWSINEDKQLRGVVRQHGLALETGDYELYQIGIEHTSEITRRLQHSISVGQGIKILPGLFILGLISAYDVFLSNLIRTILLKKPEILSSSEKSFLFKDLVEIGSIDIARERIVEKEVESVIRLSHADQIAWLEKKLVMPLTQDLKIWPEFIEICERRNLLTHTDGFVSSQYISICKAHRVDISNTKVGDRLIVDQKYYTRAVSVILEMGMKLTQVIWRKTVPNEINLAAAELNAFSYRLISNRKYKEAAEMLEFGIKTIKKHGHDAIKKQMIVNYANAIKLGGDKKQAETILDAEDWTAATDKFKICVAAVKDDVDTVISMMKRTADAGGMDASSFRDWPVFEKIRSDPRFVESFECIFDEKILLDKEAKPNIRPRGIDDDADEA